MTSTISRRDFLKMGGAAFGALATGQFIPPLVAQAARAKQVISMPVTVVTFPACARCVYGDVVCWPKFRTDAWLNWKAIRIIRTPKESYVRAAKPD